MKPGVREICLRDYLFHCEKWDECGQGWFSKKSQLLEEQVDAGEEKKDNKFIFQRHGRTAVTSVLWIIW